MTIIRKFFATLPVHLIMGGISLTLYFASFSELTHSKAIKLSLTLLIMNVVGYLLFSFLILKSFNHKEVLCSTFLFLGIGLLIWIVFLITGYLGNLYYIYHIVGYTSFIWFVYLFTDMNEILFIQLGFLFSIIPSSLILIGFYAGKSFKRR
jgi:hypothetical protein